MKSSLSFLSLALFATLAGCSSPLGGGTTDSDGETSTVRQQVINGKPSDASQDSVILLVHYDPGSGGFGQCTGTLIAPRLVLTARHCVADTDPYAACDANGEPLSAGAIRRNHKPETMYVFTGKDRPEFGRGAPKWAGQGMKILDDGGDNLCNHDIALVVLKEPVANAMISPIRLDEDVLKGEMITAVGWGVTDKTSEPDTRQQRAGVRITEVGPSRESRVAPNEFQVGESICSGDSGGPALVEPTKAVVGVVSRGGNMTQPDQSDPSATCIDGENLYTKVSPFKELIMAGFELAEAEPWLEGQPDPRLLKPGNACTDASECRSNLCLGLDAADESLLTCAQPCTEDSECAEGTKCLASGEVTVCKAPPPPPKTETTSGFCSYAPASTSSASGVLFALGALVAATRRRKR
jgi:MYXO-CTERM domain-containing protein